MKFFKILIFLFCFFSCATDDIKIIPSAIEYSDEKIRQTEIKEIEKLIEVDEIRALEKAIHLFDAASFDENVKNIFVKSEEKVFNSLKKHIENNSFLDIWKYYLSLKTCNSEKLKSLEFDFNLFFDEQIEMILNTKSQKNYENKISNYIDGTVTIWVDLGVKIEKGVGFPERVIGSGFFIDDRGYIVTNHHVIDKHVDPKYKGFSRVYVKMSDDPDSRIPAKVIGWDPTLDLALLKVEVTPKYCFKLGSSQNINIGDKIFAIGSPAGLEKTLTSGIVSAFNRKLFSVASVMQIDAAVNTGNSGGPIIDQKGNVQGIVFAGMLQFEGLNFAIPVEYLKLILPNLYIGGKIEHSWCGAYGRTKKINPIDSDGIGVEVFYTMTGGSAFYAGLQKGDLIYKIGDIEIDSIEKMQNALLYYLPNTIVPFEVKTVDGKNVVRKIRLESRPDNPVVKIFDSELLHNAMYPIFGMELVPVSDIKKKFVIKSIIPGSSADESSFSENDPVEILKVKVMHEQNFIYAEVYAKKRKNGYLDVAMLISSLLDNPFIF
ncbi:MAG: trypsin-like serine protease [Treponema sp.]|nr:trypsin-like serine protease [Treponema sp.]